MRTTTLALSTLALLTACGESAQPTGSPGQEETVAFDSSKAATEKELAEFRQKRLDAIQNMRSESFKSNFSGRENSPSKIGNNPGPTKLCVTMRKVGLGCSYNERIGLTSYLAANGRNLFTCGDGSNPYFKTKEDCDPAFDDGGSYYIGQPGQSATLEASIRKNAKLFKNGDLTPAAAARWEL